ncbi:MAG TPA: VOC family protein [Solirubrobacteraceae bacterium]|nr:VOC family protein [Solirubrobacteraceae bacterium]
MPIDHAKLPVSDLDSARDFYTLALGALGWQLVTDEAPAVLHFGTGDGGEDHEPIAFECTSEPIARCHIAFLASTREQVHAFHAAALGAGGADNGCPGERPYGQRYYAAFVLDPDGHNLEVVYKGGDVHIDRTIESVGGGA